MNRNKAVLIVLAVYVAFTCVRGFFPVSELPPSGYALFENLLDAVAVIALVGLSCSVYKAASMAGEITPGKWLGFAVLGLVAGLGILLVRAGGGPRVQLPAGIQTYAPTAPSQDAVRLRVRDAVESLKKLDARIQESRWVQSREASVFQPGNITQKDLADYQDVMRDMMAATDQVLESFTAADAVNIIISPAGQPDFLLAQRAVYLDQFQQMQLLQDHWAEWHPNGFRPDSPTLKPWQKELAALQKKGETDAKKSIELKKKVLAQP